MAKTYIMGSDEGLTEEQKKSIEKFNETKDQETKELLDKQIEMTKRKRASLEDLLKTRISPEEDRVLIWPDAVEELTEGGIIKPEEVKQKERPLFGTVLAVGPGKKVMESITHKLLLALVEQSDISNSALADLKEEIKAFTIPYVPGDRVMFGRFAGTPVEDPDTKEPLSIMRPSDIFGKIKPE